MGDAHAIHLAARRYCVDEIARWNAVYADLARNGLDRKTTDGRWDYSDAALDAFPRYLVLEAILQEVEQFIPNDFSSAEEAELMLVAAAEVAQTQYTDLEDPRARAAMHDERNRFISWLGALPPEQAVATAPLPFRRVLGCEEARRWFNEVDTRWGHWYGGAVNRSAEQLPPHLILQASMLEEQGRLGELRQMISSTGVVRVLELREWGPHYELELASASFSYNGAEAWFLSPGTDWLVQASHEDSLTIGGERLVGVLREKWADWRDLIYRGWDRQSSP